MDDILTARSHDGNHRSSIVLTVRTGEASTLTAPLDELIRAGVPRKRIDEALAEFKQEIEKETAWALPCPHCGKMRFDPVEQ
jgi:hypothetical protein